MKKTTEEKLAKSLTAETTELLPFLPYLFQDFWELGIDPEVITELICENVALPKEARILDLACGKGAVSIRLAEKFSVRVKGIDLIPEFIKHAKEKAQEFMVADLCEFMVDDINEAVDRENGFDCVVYGAVGDVLGDYAETLMKLKATVRKGGYLLLDNYDFITEEQWTALFKETGLELVATISDVDRVRNDEHDTFRLISDSDLGIAAITRRAKELIEKHPDKQTIFAEYIRSQQEEYDSIDKQSSLTNITWILKKH